jgi:hypothetical protein
LGWQIRLAAWSSADMTMQIMAALAAEDYKTVDQLATRHAKLALNYLANVKRAMIRRCLCLLHDPPDTTYPEICGPAAHPKLGLGFSSFSDRSSKSLQITEFTIIALILVAMAP